MEVDGEGLPMVTVVLLAGVELRVGTRLEASEAREVLILRMEVPGTEDPGWVIITSKAMEVPGGVKVEVRLLEAQSPEYPGRTMDLQVRRMELPQLVRTRPWPRLRWLPGLTTRTFLPWAAASTSGEPGPGCRSSEASIPSPLR